VHLVDHFFDHPDYIAGIVDRVNSVLRQLPWREEVHLVFSAHGLPMSLVEKGDPYPQHIEATVRLVRELGAWPNPHSLCYQSKVGPQKWLQPSLTATLEGLASDGVKRMLVIPISFLTEHIETLHEINIEAREHAEALGVTDFHMMPALNDSPLLIRALADLVLRAVGRRAGVASLATCNRGTAVPSGSLSRSRRCLAHSEYMLRERQRIGARFARRLLTARLKPCPDENPNQNPQVIPTKCRPERPELHKHRRGLSLVLI